VVHTLRDLGMLLSRFCQHRFDRPLTIQTLKPHVLIGARHEEFDDRDPRESGAKTASCGRFVRPLDAFDHYGEAD